MAQKKNRGNFGYQPDKSLQEGYQPTPKNNGYQPEKATKATPPNRGSSVQPNKKGK